MKYVRIFGLVFLIFFAIGVAKGIQAGNNNKIENGIHIWSTTDLRNEYSNVAAGDKNFTGKQIAVKGVILSINKTGNTYMVHVGEKGDINGVACKFKSSKKDSLSDYTTGDEIVIQGKCEGKKLMEIWLNSCDILD